ncbi:hypothetical protein [Actinomadura flavalba]|uniref:hypothetical protein n=1 Tax=Actinomadura flavalba TaxID=1120938 RepID=UPI0003792CEA|nr:hypothetical protein [Actinomadura flavalba]
MRRLIIGAVLTAAVGTGLTGCGGDDEPKQSPQVAWADKVCTSIGINGQKLALPAVDADTQKYKANIELFLDQVGKRLETMETGLKSAGAPPVDGAQPTVDKALAKLTETRESLGKAREELKKADVNDKAELSKELSKLSKVMVPAATYQGPREDLRADPKLTQAFDTAPACKASTS